MPWLPRTERVTLGTSTPVRVLGRVASAISLRKPPIEALPTYHSSTEYLDASRVDVESLSELDGPAPVICNRALFWDRPRAESVHFTTQSTPAPPPRTKSLYAQS